VIQKKRSLFRLFLSVFAVLLILEFSLAIHEYGHLREFQKLNIPVQEFVLGIGPELFRHTTSDGYDVALKLVPIMAYVKATEEGQVVFEEQRTSGERIATYAAGVRNNFVCALTLLFIAQFVSFYRGSSLVTTLRRGVKNILSLPMVFILVIADACTLGFFSLTSRPLISIGPFPVKDEEGRHSLFAMVVTLNLLLAFFNLIPVGFMDGYKITLEVLPYILSEQSSGMLKIVLQVSFLIVVLGSNMCSFRFLKTDDH